MEGSHEALPIMHKKAIYRIICEGICNAVRHGKSGDIAIELIINPDTTSLKIKDDGIGFEFAQMEEEQMGMGIRNIHQLTNWLRGTIDIESRIGSGTEIKINLPNATQKIE